ncbi:MAG TPA: hypothetical protein VMP11_20320 [Verrucomicrobiae bacterium]|nr:hypothetical protein [Verrucomicrobiae bacterium]
MKNKNTAVSTFVVSQMTKAKMKFASTTSILGLTSLLAATMTPNLCRACACGCGVFDVGTGLMLPENPGGMAWVEYDYQDQDQNWHWTSPAPGGNNDDKEIRTHFVTAGYQYMVDRSWGFQVEVPYDYRYFQTTGGKSGDDIVSLDWGALGDIRVEGLYTGFFPDMSAGINFGFKLPTGDYTRNDPYDDIDRDSEIGTGSLDVLLGGFYRHALTTDNSFTWFGQTLLDLPIVSRNDYTPGTEIDAASGVYYKGWSIHQVHITPLAQVIGSERTSDHGTEAAQPVASGYQRIMVSPGVEVDMHPVSFYADVEVPVFLDMRGDQLVARWLLKTYVSYHF